VLRDKVAHLEKELQAMTELKKESQKEAQDGVKVLTKQIRDLMAENKRLLGANQSSKPSKTSENRDSFVVDDEEKKGQEAILALLNQNSDRASDNMAQEEEVTSLYATAKTSKKVDEDQEQDTPVFETAIKHEKAESPVE
jgi:hypothetical protein